MNCSSQYRNNTHKLVLSATLKFMKEGRRFENVMRVCSHYRYILGWKFDSMYICLLEANVIWFSFLLFVIKMFPFTSSHIVMYMLVFYMHKTTLCCPYLCPIPLYLLKICLIWLCITQTHISQPVSLCYWVIAPVGFPVCKKPHYPGIPTVNIPIEFPIRKS